MNRKLQISFLISITILLCQCKKTPVEVTNQETTTLSSGKSSAVNTLSLADTLNVSQAITDGGYAYRLTHDFGISGDSNNQPAISRVRVFENGVELGPAHSIHADIRSLGGGRFSHWGNRLFFSASDNTDPRYNGRTYTYIISPIGFASVGAGTTGGFGGQTVSVSTLEDLQDAAASTLPLIIKVSGILTGTGSIIVKSNKTIIGVNGATLDGVGLRIFGTSTSDYVSNIIIQNLKIKNVIAIDPETQGGDNDCIGLKWADHVWIDHCELSADTSHDWDYYDGLIDISKQSDYVTISWTKFSNSFKASGVGGSSDAGLGKLRITYHHNLFENIGERAPSYGYGTGHVFNNYFLNSATGSGYAVGSRFGAVVLVENNYFESINYPIRTDIDSIPGYIGGLNTNIFIDSVAVTINTLPSTYSPSYEYISVLTPAADVPSVVLAGVGVQ